MKAPAIRQGRTLRPLCITLAGRGKCAVLHLLFLNVYEWYCLLLGFYPAAFWVRLKKFFGLKAALPFC
jgi:hypothetical protein